jgi:hypothetical protein
MVFKETKITKNWPKITNNSPKITKNANFFAENWRKTHKNVIITSTPRLFFFHRKNNALICQKMGRATFGRSELVLSPCFEHIFPTAFRTLFRTNSETWQRSRKSLLIEEICWCKKNGQK